MKYQIGITTYNTFEVEADSKEEAQNKVRDYCNDAISKGWHQGHLGYGRSISYSDEIINTDEINE
tara:strand:+ start:268 stop:462 length:195 start_codon:yes stop_codon:yes gene_type:complete